MLVSSFRRWGNCFIFLAVSPSVLLAQTAEDLSAMSIAELADIDVSSVTRSAGALSDAPASIFVITRDDIVRAGATTVGEMLRIAPNLHVARTGASTYNITARGLNGNSAAQNFPNKLLVLIDGRSVYTPTFSGVYWDMQAVLPADVDRIEVISGPGATLWGANAFNGVVNIITRKSGNSQGLVATATGGNQIRDVGLRYGGERGDTISYRIYANVHAARASDLPGGGSAQDRAHRVQGGFRVDWTPADADMFTLQGDVYRGKRRQGADASERISGHNLLARWNRTGSDGSALQVQAYYDYARRGRARDSGASAVDTFDLDVQHGFALGRRHRIVWGGGARLNRTDIVASPPPNELIFAPPKRSLVLANAFVQDSVALSDRLTAILGLKVEDHPYVAASLLPSVRLSWKAGDDLLLWAAASRAVRSPTPFDRDVIERVNGTTFVIGGSRFRTEKVTAYEMGTRFQPIIDSTISISAFYNDYDDLRSVELTPVTLLPLFWGNGLRGRGYGFDAWADHQLAPWWRMGAGWSFLEQRFRPKAGTNPILGSEQLGNDPKHRVSLRSSMSLGPAVSLDAKLRYVSKLPNPRVKHHVELDARIAWQLSDRLSLALVGSNLLHKRHIEYAGANAVPRSVFAELRWQP